MKWVFVFILFFVEVHALKVLHLSLHKGTLNEFEAIAHELSLDITSWYIHELPAGFFDEGAKNNNQIYNMGHDRAKRIWEKHKNFFNEFDVIVTSDTAPLSRIFLQNDFKKPLIIWICNRFDYSDEANRDCPFPDPEYYDLIRQASKKKNVKIIANTPFEIYYAASKGVNINPLIIKPCSPIPDIEPAEIRETFYIPSRHNEMDFIDLDTKLKRFAIKTFQGRYEGPADIQQYRGVIHLPYAWSTIQFFENLQLGLPYFLPSKKFLKKLLREKNYWFQDSGLLLKDNLFHLCEWYDNDLKDVVIYFDSWQDLAQKIKSTNYADIRARTKAFGHRHRVTMLARWKMIFDEFQSTKKA